MTRYCIVEVPEKGSNTRTKPCSFKAREGHYTCGKHKHVEKSALLALAYKTEQSAILNYRKGNIERARILARRCQVLFQEAGKEVSEEKIIQQLEEEYLNS